MLARWPIRYKLIFGIAVVCLIVAILSFSGFRGAYAYRGLVRGISLRAAEYPKAAELMLSVVELRHKWQLAEDWRDVRNRKPIDAGLVREEFYIAILDVRLKLRDYKERLESESEATDPLIDNKQREWKSVENIEATLDRVAALTQESDWLIKEVEFDQVRAELDQLYEKAKALPTYLHDRMLSVRNEVRGQYRTWIVLSWTSTILTGLMLLLLVRFFRQWVFHPLRVILDGSRRVAAGDFQHRISLDSHDEMAELAHAMNDMTSRFQQIRDDLDRQVQQRTKEVVRSEKLASVGFLAAGVAHEINNPMASIAWCAESLESRMDELMEDRPEIGQLDEFQVLQRYLRTIQDEAFRCKDITERLLDFSRMGSSEKENTDLRELAESVIEMVRHLGKYRGKQIVFHGDTVQAIVNAQEVKQIVLNLVTNALDSVDAEGRVDVYLDRVRDSVRIRVADDGCGMSDEVLQHLFEPFFTRRRDGQGTGLGLSITYRIVEEHGGTIEAHSDGPAKGSQFVVTLPIRQVEKRHERKSQAA